MTRPTRTVFRLGLEPLEERYTGQWARWLPETLASLGHVLDLHGETLEASVVTGAFLDLHSHAYWQAKQLAKVARLFHNGAVQDGDVFWLDDIEFPGMEQIRYLARLSGIRVFIFGFLHAASYTREDFMAPMADVGQYAERSWVAACDAVFVGSQYHAQTFVSRRCQGATDATIVGKVHMTGNPFRSAELHRVAGAAPGVYADRDIHVLYPHRPDREKRPLYFLRWAEALLARDPTTRIAFTTGRASYRSTNDPTTAEAILAFAAENSANVTVHTGLTRADYLRLLARARLVVSTAIEENYGYAMAEALAMGAVPFMPAAYSYPELLAPQWPGTLRWPEVERACLYPPGVPGCGTWTDTLARALTAAHTPFDALSHSHRARILTHLDGAERRMVEVMARVMAEAS